jgi:signal transduction histidine kinase
VPGERLPLREITLPAERLRRLQSVTDVALGSLSLEELLDEILDRIRDALEADTCAILLLDEERNELVARAAKGIEEEVEQGVRIPVGLGFAGRVAAERRPVYLADVDHAFVLNPILREKGIRSLLGAPLLARDRVLGVVHVGTLRHRVFTGDEIDLLQLVAERVAVAIERTMLHDELVELDRLKQEFISTAAHELRTPASIIFGVAMTLACRRDTLDEDTVDELLDAFYDSSVRLTGLIEEVLDFSRLESARLSVRREPLLAQELLEGVVLELSPIVSDVEVDAAAGLTITSDRSILRRVLANLVSNASIHGEPPIRLSAVQENGGTLISVEDNGPGVPEGFVGRLFDPFARGGDTDGRPGAGLGLAIAKSYAHRLGGDLTYERAESGGARFSFVLPTLEQAAPLPT